MKLFFRFCMLIWSTMVLIALLSPTMYLIPYLSAYGQNTYETSQPVRLDGNYDTSEFFKNERINVLFITENGNYSWGLAVENGTVVDSIGGVDDPTVVIKCDYYLARDIMNSKQPIARIIDELAKGNIIEVHPDNPLEKAFLDEAKRDLMMTKSVGEWTK